MRKLAATLGALVLGAGLAAVPAGSAAAQPPVRPGASLLQIVITPHEDSTWSGRIIVLLSCDLVGNTHPYPTEACAEVEAANGDIDKIDPNGGICIALWDPLNIVVRGIVKGRAVQWSDTVSNWQCAQNGYGHLFDVFSPSAPTG